MTSGLKHYNKGALCAPSILTLAQVAQAHSHPPVEEVLLRFTKIAQETGAWTPQLIEAARLVLGQAQAQHRRAR